MKEAAARIKINKLLEAAGWRFFPTAQGPTNIQLEANAKITIQALDDLGENFEKIKTGFIDFLLLNEKGFPFIVLEAKAEDKSPLVGKEQARKYAKSQNCRFVILSNPSHRSPCWSLTLQILLSPPQHSTGVGDKLGTMRVQEWRPLPCLPTLR